MANPADAGSGIGSWRGVRDDSDRQAEAQQFVAQATAVLERPTDPLGPYQRALGLTARPEPAAGLYQQALGITRRPTGMAEGAGDSLPSFQAAQLEPPGPPDLGQIGPSGPVGGETATSPLVNTGGLGPKFLPPGEVFQQAGAAFFGGGLPPEWKPSGDPLADIAVVGAGILGATGNAFPPLAAVPAVAAGGLKIVGKFGKAAREIEGAATSAERLPAVLPEIRSGWGGRGGRPPVEPGPPIGPAPAPPRLPGKGEIPPWENPPERIEELLNTQTAGKQQSDFVGGLRADVDRFLGLFRRPSPAEQEARGQALSSLVRYDGQVARAIPREVGTEVRGLREELAAAEGRIPKVAKGLASRVKATAEPVKADAFVDQRVKNAITLSLDDFAGADVRQFLNQLGPETRLFRDKLRQGLDEMGKILVDQGVLDPDELRDNYISHIWQIAEGEKPPSRYFGRPEGMPIRRAYFEKERDFKTFEQGIVAGRVPATLDPLDLYEHFMIEARRRIAGQQLINDVRQINPDLIVQHQPGTPLPEGYQTVDHPFFLPEVKVAELPSGRGGSLSTEVQPTITVKRPEWVVNDQLAPLFRALFEPSKLRQTPGLREALQATAAVKRSVLGAPLMFDLNMVGYESKAAAYVVGAREAAKAFTGALRTVGRPDLYDGLLKQPVKIGSQVQTRAEWLRKLDEAGLTGNSYTSEIVRMLGDQTPRTLLGRVIPRYEQLQNIGEAVQFQDIIPKLKYETALTLVGQKVKGGLSVDAAVNLAARDVNKAMGGLNRIALGRSQTTQDALALALIAPDWAESRLRQFASIFAPGATGATARQATGRMIGTGIMSVVGGTALWGALSGKSPERIGQEIARRLSPIKVDAEGKRSVNPDFLTFPGPGGERTTVLTWELEGAKVLMGLAAYAAGDTETGDILAGRHAKARIGVLPRFGLDVVRNQDWKEQPIRTADNVWGQLAQFLGYEGQTTALPANLQQFGQTVQGQLSPMGSALTISGAGRATPRQEMPDVIRQALTANDLDANRVGSFYDLPPAEQMRLMQMPEVERFFQSRKTETARLAQTERGLKAAEERWQQVPPDVRKALENAGIYGMGEVGNTISVADGLPSVLLSRSERHDYQNRAAKSIEALLPRLLTRPAFQRASRADQKALIEDVMRLAREDAATETLRQIGAAEIKHRVRAGLPVAAGQ